MDLGLTRAEPFQNYYTHEGEFHESALPETRDKRNPVASANRAAFSSILAVMKSDFIMTRSSVLTLGDMLVDGSYYGLTPYIEFVPEVLEKEFGSTEYVGIFGKYGTLCLRAFISIFKKRPNAVENLRFAIANLKDAEVLRKRGIPAFLLADSEPYNAVKETRMMLEEIENKRLSDDREWMVAFRTNAELEMKPSNEKAIKLFLKIVDSIIQSTYA